MVTNDLYLTSRGKWSGQEQEKYLPRGRAAKRIVGAQGKYKKWGPYCVRGSGSMPPENFEILYALKCVLRASQVPFCTCRQYIPTCQLPSLFSGFRSKSTTYRALASSCVEVT